MSRFVHNFLQNKRRVIELVHQALIKSLGKLEIISICYAQTELEGGGGL